MEGIGYSSRCESTCPNQAGTTTRNITILHFVRRLMKRPDLDRGSMPKILPVSRPATVGTGRGSGRLVTELSAGLPDDGARFECARWITCGGGSSGGVFVRPSSRQTWPISASRGLSMQPITRLTASATCLRKATSPRTWSARREACGRAGFTSSDFTSAARRRRGCTERGLRAC